MKFGSILSALALATFVSALTPAQWRSQSVYQVLTDRFARTDGSTTAACDALFGNYCGGTWRGIINHLDYIQNMGFTAIWISPIVKNLDGSSMDGQSYHGYWAQDIYSLNSNFGTEQDLLDLSSALHKRGMYLMVDVVVNHMGYLGCGDCVDYSVFKPFNSKSYFHPFCLIDYNNENSVQQCWEGDNTVSLPDLRSEDANVRSIWNDWIKQLVAKYSIDGLRLDSARQVETSFYPGFESAAGVYIVGEVYLGDPAVVCPYQKSLSGVLNYPTYFRINETFAVPNGNIGNFVNGVNAIKSACDTTLLGSFMENHDVPRFASYTSDLSLAKNAIAFTILTDGIPIIYEGQEQHLTGAINNENREAIWLSKYSTTSPLYTWIAKLNQIRNQAIFKDSSYVIYQSYPSYSDNVAVVLRKGSTGFQVITVLSNKGAGGDSYTLNLATGSTGFTANQALVEVMGCTTHTADGSGNLAVDMAGGLPRVFYPRAQLTGSGICSAVTG